MVLLPETSSQSAMETGNRLRRAFNLRWSSYQLQTGQVPVPVSMSMGVVQAKAGESARHFVKRGDVALYTAKTAGGDQVLEAPQLVSVKG